MTRVFVLNTFFNDTKAFQRESKKFYIDNDYLWNTAVYFYLFWFWELKPTKTGIGALNHTIIMQKTYILKNNELSYGQNGFKHTPAFDFLNS